MQILKVINNLNFEIIQKVLKLYKDLTLRIMMWFLGKEKLWKNIYNLNFKNLKILLKKLENKVNRIRYNRN